MTLDEGMACDYLEIVIHLFQQAMVRLVIASAAPADHMMMFMPADLAGQVSAANRDRRTRPIFTKKSGVR